MEKVYSQSHRMALVTAGGRSGQGQLMWRAIVLRPSRKSQHRVWS